jgi:arylsulfatase A-like enzyme
MSHFPVIFGDIIKPLCAVTEERSENRWFIHMHAMDAHDCRSISRFAHFLYRLRFFPRWFIGRMRGYTKRRWIYDTAVMYVDHLLGRLFDTLDRTGQMDNTVILVTGDHGLQYAESPRKKYAVGYRTHYEDLEVPLLLANSGREPADLGMIDSMGVTATFLDALDVPLHQSFKGISALRSGRACVISENCGHGNADLARRDIYFTVTSETHKMMSVLKEKSLYVEKLYDRRIDPREVQNLIDDPAQKPTIDELIRLLRAERAEIFALREGAAATA